MRRLALALIFAAAAPSAWALERPPVCAALHGLAEAARASQQPQRVSVSASGGGFNCLAADRTTDPTAFCAAATAAIGGEGVDMFPWRVHACVDTLSSDTQKVTVAGDVGPAHRKRLSRLTASLGHGVRFDLSAAGDRYELVVWAAK